MKERIFVFTGLSGSGKSTIADAVIGYKNLARVVTYTTRPAREGEVDRKDYNFISREEFRGKINQGYFLEWAEVYGNLYGNPRTDLENLLSSGKNALYVIDIRGAKTIRKFYPEAILIFIKTYGLEELRKRLITRGKDSPEVIDKRMKREAIDFDEPSRYNFNHVLINNQLDRAISEIKGIIDRYV